MMAYKFSGYWKDVGTIDSLFEANMDLLGDVPKFNVTDSSWKIQTRSPMSPPHFIGDGARTVNSIILTGCEIYGDVENSVISSDVVIEKGAVVRNSVIMSDVTVKSGAKIEYAIIDENTVIEIGAKIGEPKENGNGIAVLSRNITVGKNAVIKGGAMIDKDVEGGAD